MATEIIYRTRGSRDNACRNLQWYYTVLYQFYPEDILQHEFKIVAESLAETLNASGESVRPVPVSRDGHGSMKQERNTEAGQRKLSNFG